MGEEPSLGVVLLVMTLVGAGAAVVGGAVIVSMIGLVLWAKSFWRRKRGKKA